MNDLRLLFPGFMDVFKNPFSVAALRVLKDYPSPEALKSCDLKQLVSDVADGSRRSEDWARKKLVPLFDYSQIADAIGLACVPLEEKLRIQIQTVEGISHSMKSLEKAIRQQVDSLAFPEHFRRNIHLLDAMPGIGFITAVTLIAEMGDFSRFRTPKAFVAFFGVDPTVKESGKFKGNQNRMSKRGTKLGRRVLFTAAMASVRKTRKGDAINPVLKEYYDSKTVSKKKKVALVAVMHKILHYIFAVLRDQKPYEPRLPNVHWDNHQSNLRLVA
jgi:transposase